MKVRLSEFELQLVNEAIKDAGSKFIIEVEEFSSKYIISLNDDEAEDLRGFVGDDLYKIGFDENYRTNAKGAVLEGLIDKLFIG